MPAKGVDIDIQLDDSVQIEVSLSDLDEFPEEFTVEQSPLAPPHSPLTPIPPTQPDPISAVAAFHIPKLDKAEPILPNSFHFRDKKCEKHHSSLCLNCVSLAQKNTVCSESSEPLSPSLYDIDFNGDVELLNFVEKYLPDLDLEEFLRESTEIPQLTELNSLRSSNSRDPRQSTRVYGKVDPTVEISTKALGKSSRAYPPVEKENNTEITFLTPCYTNSSTSDITTVTNIYNNPVVTSKEYLQSSPTVTVNLPSKQLPRCYTCANCICNKIPVYDSIEVTTSCLDRTTTSTTEPSLAFTQTTAPPPTLETPLNPDLNPVPLYPVLQQPVLSHSVNREIPSLLDLVLDKPPIKAKEITRNNEWPKRGSWKGRSTRGAWRKRRFPRKH